MRTCAAAIAAACALAGAASAQEPASPAPAAAPAPPPAALLPAGSIVEIELAEPVSSKTAKRGDRFAIRLAAPILLGDQTLVPAGTRGVGQVVDAASSGPLGRPAKLLLAARYLEFEGRQIPLRAFRLGGHGADTSDAAMAAALIPYVGLLAGFIHGGEIEIPALTRANAKLAADLTTPAPPAPAAPAEPKTEATP